MNTYVSCSYVLLIAYILILYLSKILETYDDLLVTQLDKTFCTKSANVDLVLNIFQLNNREDDFL